MSSFFSCVCEPPEKKPKLNDSASDDKYISNSSDTHVIDSKEEDEILCYEDEEIEYNEDGSHEMTRKEWDLYCQQVEASDGFDVRPFPKAEICSIITPLDLDEYQLKIVSNLSNVAIERYNKDKGTDYKFVKVQKANAELVGGIFFYITFEAKNGDDVQPKIFQARVLMGIPDQTKIEIDFCRPKPY